MKIQERDNTKNSPVLRKFANVYSLQNQFEGGATRGVPSGLVPKTDEPPVFAGTFGEIAQLET
jgi:hypothetical protein